MTDNYSYAELSVRTSNTTIRADDDPESSDMESFEPDTLQVHDPSVPTLEWKSALAPIGTFALGVALATGHHAFNILVTRRPVAANIISQDWVTRIGVGFSFGFKTSLGFTMGFVLLQFLWLSIRRRSFTIKEIDTLYDIERCTNLYRTLPQALFFSPLLVIFSILTFLLPLSGVFAPGSLTVTTEQYNDTGPCTIPAGNLNGPNVPGLYIIKRTIEVSATNTSYTTNITTWGGVMPSVTILTTQWLVGQRIPNLPQACGPNCLYRVPSVPSFVFNCQPNPVSLPHGQLGDPRSTSNIVTVWNATTDPKSTWAFYIAWQNTDKRASGSAYCLPVQAKYDVKVQTTGGIQSVTTNIIKTSLPLNESLDMNNNDNDPLGMQIASLSYATQALFLGNITVDDANPKGQLLNVHTLAVEASFANTSGSPLLDWTNVLQGIEDMSHNVSIGLLSADLQLGNMNATCLFNLKPVIYQYDPSALWVPYSIALGVTLLSLIGAIVIMVKYNTGQITTSFSDTIRATKRVEEVSESEKFNLGVVSGGKLEYSAVEKEAASVQKEMDRPSFS